MVMTGVGVVRVVLDRRRSIGQVLLGVDRTDRAYVRLVARRARGAFVEIDVQHRITEDRDRVRVRTMAVLDDAAAGFDLGHEHVVDRIELVDALHGAHIDASPILDPDARFGDDGYTGHAPTQFGVVDLQRGH